MRDPVIHKAILTSMRKYWKDGLKDMKTSQGERRYSKDFFDKFEGSVGESAGEEDELDT